MNCVTEKRKLRVAEKDILNKSSFTKGREVSIDMKLTLGGAPYNIVPCTFNPGEEADFRFVRLRLSCLPYHHHESTYSY
jgi:hypothetical protein